MANTNHRLNSSASDASFKLSCDSVLKKLIPQEKSVIDSILAHDNPDEGEILLSDGDKYVWYLAIGSMTNPVSLYLRDLRPIFSYPATCLDCRVVFRAPDGMADIEDCPGAAFDGVVHLLSDDQMKQLDELEISYHRVKVNCLDYQNRSHVAYAYQMSQTGQLAGTPHERYLDIIVKGCEYYQVRPDYINRLRNEQPVIPRTHPDKFKSFTDFPSDAWYTLEDLQKHDGNDPSIPMWMCLNGKVLEYAGLPSTDHPDYPRQRRFHRFCQQKLAGREIVGLLAKGLYEPLYKLPLSDEDICLEQRAHIEDHYYGMIANPTGNTYWKTIGRLRQTDSSA